ncbi:hypothetical protein SAMN04488508_10452 [Aquimarina spongiae]|uniref:Uncharacterized protein n=1 Tax=Aquimarina spongiae TaxID=570521 RepID=A0A1M6F1U6_9FLAO|nr:hypothetical protein SAMN04488508_10452 [Aquimarina spongiae]
MLKFCVFCRFIRHLNVIIENILHISVPLENRVPFTHYFLRLNKVLTHTYCPYYEKTYKSLTEVS